MNNSLNDKIRSLLAEEKWPELVPFLRAMPFDLAAELLGKLPDEHQQTLFRLLPLQFAAALVTRFPYYHQYILLHSRSTEEMRQIIDLMAPDQRMQFFDELPEEVWQRLMDELAGREYAPPQAQAEESGTQVEVAPAKTEPAAVPQVPMVAPRERETGEVVIEARGVEKSFLQPDGTRVQVIAPLDLSVSAGTVVALLGASGCGKSTLLRILSGLSAPTSGCVMWHGVPCAQANPNVAIVFQSFALFPWLTVLENVEAPLIARGVVAEERRRRAVHALDTVGLKGFQTAYPKELSGGMKQRVGFARALVVQPEVLFMDEPFSALDVLTAESLRGELLELWLNKKIDTKTIFIVTHNIEEAVLLADRIIVLGRNPAHIRADFRVPLPQPRERKSPQFLLYVDYIYKVMTKPDVKFAPPPQVGEKRVYQPLPHARPGGIAGLLELLIDRGGEEDLYHLAEQLLMDIEDLLPIIEAAALLGFARLEQGDVEITPEGRSFAEADIATRKTLFRRAALKNVLLFRQIDSALRAKADHTISIELFRDLLDEHFPETEVERQLDTALNWGRECELFTYDSGSERLHLILHPEEGAEVPAGAASGQDSSQIKSS
jgi:NitT/TauT family transport system ATP-binding protein